MNDMLLQLLVENRGYWLTMESLQKSLRLAPSKIIEQVEQLNRQGHLIEAIPAYGFRLAENSNQLSAELLTRNLDTKRIGKHVLAYQVTDSTNDIVWQYSREINSSSNPVNYDGLAVFAEFQRAGRGRLGRNWQAKTGSSILGSILLINSTPLTATSLTLLAGLSVAQAINQTCNLQTRIKWPNDIMAAGRKLAGIMVESRKINPHYHAYAIGIGINCLQEKNDFDDELADTAISIKQITGDDVNRLQLIRKLLSRLDYWLMCTQNEQTRQLHDCWLNLCDDVGRRITVINDGQSFTGRVIGVGIEEGLFLQPDDGPVKIFDCSTTTVKK
jgi:BirA family transcriptional regulator, biotin operon repressor / biotin---[acetyl-CoA-carboxylase] ligase